MASSISPAVSSQLIRGHCLVPASPCMPSPISMSGPSSRSFVTSAPGTVTALSATPIVDTPFETVSAAAVTSARLAPSSPALPPAALCTNTVPATPLAPVMPLARAKAQSSATTTMETSYPSAAASSRAIPKLSRSPV